MHIARYATRIAVCSCTESKVKLTLKTSLEYEMIIELVKSYLGILEQGRLLWHLYLQNISDLDK